MAALPAGKTYLPTADVAKRLGVTMGRVRQLAILGPDHGGLTRYWAAPTALVFDEAEVRRLARRKPKTGRPKGGFKAN